MYTTLFLLMSLDGKISTGVSDNLDFDTDFAHNVYLEKGLHQYYEIERTTDEWSVISGRTAAKLGANNGNYFKVFVNANFIVIDNSHLTPEGRQHIADNCERAVFVMEDKAAVECSKLEATENMDFVLQSPLDLTAVLHYVEERYGVHRVTVQTGGTLNQLFLQQGAIDAVDIVIAPVLVGGRSTPTAVDGTDRCKVEQLDTLSLLEFQQATPMSDGYVRMRYTVIK